MHCTLDTEQNKTKQKNFYVYKAFNKRVVCKKKKKTVQDSTAVTTHQFIKRSFYDTFPPRGEKYHLTPDKMPKWKTEW